jgi:hypothetical protein
MPDHVFPLTVEHEALQSSTIVVEDLPHAAMVSSPLQV